MKLLSIDVGIKNLAFCLLNVSASSPPAISECDILQWGVIDVCHSEQDEIAAVQRAAAHHKCSHTLYNSKNKSKSIATTTTTKTTTTTCTSNAAFFYYKEDHLQFICKRHATKMRESDKNNKHGNNQPQLKVFHFASDVALKTAKLLKTGTAEQLFAFCKAHDALESDWEVAAPRWHGLKPVMRDRARHVMRTQYMHAYDALDEISAILNPAPVPATVPAPEAQVVININSNTLLKSKLQPEHVSLIIVGSNLMIKFDKLFYGSDSTSTSPDKVIIENQISPIATRMKTVQGMVTQYFLMRGISPDCISYISATNKLKAWTSINSHADSAADAAHEIDTYDGRKKMGIACVRKLLSGDNVGNGTADADADADADATGDAGVKRKKFKMSANTALQWRFVFESHKKKDDMADSLLQGLSYL